MKQASLAIVLLSLVALPAVAGERPPLTVAAAELSCPGITGAFVAVLDRERGLLVLSSAPFIGGSRVASADGTVVEPWLAAWNLDRLAVPDGAAGAFAAVWPFLGAGGAGCVAFDKEQFSSEGDLASYARWLAEEIYLQLPADQRHRYPAFALRERPVALTVLQHGFQPMALAGKEGSTLGFRVAGAEGTYLLLPFIVDQATGELAVKLMHTAGDYLQQGEKRFLRWVEVSPTEPAELSEPEIILSVAAAAAE